LPTAKDAASKMHLKFGTFSFSVDSNYTTDANQTASREMRFSYADGYCDVDKSNSYLGEITCALPLLSFEHKEKGESSTVKSKEWKMKAVTTAKNGKVKSDGSFEIGTIEVQDKSMGDPLTVVLDKFKVEASTYNMDESLIKSLYALASTPHKDSNQSITKTMEIVGEMFSTGMNIDYHVALQSIDGKSGANHFKVDAVNEKGTVSFADTYDFKDLLSISDITVTDEAKGDTLFALKKLQFGSEVRKLYNFVPGFMAFSGYLAQHPERPEPTAEEKKKLLALGMKMVNNGFGIAYSPVSIEGIKIAEAKVDYGKIQLDLDATLKPNTVQFQNAMSAMRLLGFLQADGKLVLNKKDLESMSNNFPPQVMAMVMMYAKYEGDKAIFVLRFDKGHLMVNDKPVM